MFSVEEADSWIGRTALDSSGEQIGMITQIWVDDESGRPEWASVRFALGGREALVPLAGTAAVGGGRQFAYAKEEIVDAPQVARDGRLEVEEKKEISFYYGAPAPDSAPRAESWVDRLEDAAQLTRRPSTPPPAGAGNVAVAPEKEGGRFRRKPSAPKPVSEKEGGRFRRKPAAPKVATEKEGGRFRRKPAAPKVASEKESKRRFRRKPAPVAEHDEVSVAA